MKNAQNAQSYLPQRKVVKSKLSSDKTSIAPSQRRKTMQQTEHLPSIATKYASSQQIQKIPSMYSVQTKNSMKRRPLQVDVHYGLHQYEKDKAEDDPRVSLLNEANELAFSSELTGQKRSAKASGKSSPSLKSWTKIKKAETQAIK
jgi:hypothetical protein